MSLDPANAGADVPPAETPPHYGLEWVLLIFDKPVTSLPGSVMISSKLDLDMEHAGTACRISFYGNVCHIFEGEEDRLKLNLIRVRQPPPPPNALPRCSVYFGLQQGP